MFVSTSAVIEQKKSIRFDPDYQAVIDKAKALGYALPSHKQQIKQNSLLLALKHTLIWNQLDVVYVFANDGSRQFGTLNWKNPNTNQVTEHGTLTWTSNQGFAGDGSTGYLNTNFNGGLQDNNSFGAWINSNTAETSKYLYGRKGAASGTRSDLTARSSSNVLQVTNNKNDWFNVTDSNQIGLWMNQRASASSFMGYKNGVSVGNLTSTSSTPPTGNFYILARSLDNSPEGHSVAQVSMFFHGTAMSGYEAHLYRVWNEYFSNITSSSPYTTEYQAILDRATTLGYKHPTPQEKIWQNQLVYDLKSVNIWNDFDVFYNFWVHDSDFATINWKTPTSNQITKVNNPTFTKHSGFRGNGTSSYLNTNWIPSGGTSFTLNSAGGGAYIGTTGNTGGTIFGCRNATQSNQFFLQPYTANAGNEFRYGVNNTSTDSTNTNNTSSIIGVWHIKRTGASALAAHRNGFSFESSTEASQARPSVSLYIGALNDNGTPVGYATHQIGMFWAGASLNTSEYMLYSIWANYQNLTAQIDWDYKKIVDRARQLAYTLPSYEQRIKQSNLIKNLKLRGYWSLVDAFFMFINDGGSDFATINWKNPLQAQASKVNSPGWTINGGFTTNGSTSYVETGSITYSNVTQNNSQYGFYVTASMVSSSGARVAVHSSVTNTMFVALDTGANIAGRLTQNGTTNFNWNSIANFTSGNYYYTRRTSSSTIVFGSNSGTDEISRSSTSGSFTNPQGVDFFQINGTLYATNGFGIGMFWCGSGSLNSSGMFNVLNVYLSNP